MKHLCIVTTVALFLFGSAYGNGYLTNPGGSGAEADFVIPSSVDKNGVDLTRLQVVARTPGVSVGNPEAGGLTFYRTYRHSGTTPGHFQSSWSHNHAGGIGGADDRRYVTIGDYSAVFRRQSGVYKEVTASGASLEYSSSNNEYTLTMGDGTIAIFDETYRLNVGSRYTVNFFANKASLVHITRPNGEEIYYNYVGQEVNGEYYYRVQSITNNYGYQIHLKYDSNINPFAFDWFVIAKVTAINRNVDTSCDYQDVACDNMTHDWPYETYTGGYHQINTSSDALGRTYIYNYATAYFDPPFCNNNLPGVSCSVHQHTLVHGPDQNLNGSDYQESAFDHALTSIKYPPDISGARKTISYSYIGFVSCGGGVCTKPLAARVKDATIDGDTWSYALSNGVITVTNPDSTTRSYDLISFYDKGYTSNDSSPQGRFLQNAFETVTDENGDITTYEYFDAQSDLYGNFSRVKKITRPEGDRVEFTYDTRGNQTQVKISPKTGSSAQPLITSATFPLACTNRKTCNKPTSATDARNKVTTFTYNSGHGGLQSIKQPSVSGVSPEQRITYESVTAQSPPQPFSSLQTIYRQKSNISCATSNFVGAYGANDNCSAGSVDKTISTTLYGASGAARYLPTSVTAKAGDNSVSATTTTSYTHAGNPDIVDGPAANDNVRYVYDAMRRQIGVIGPDPDGGGPLKHRATRTSYHPYGGVEWVERGTVANQSQSTVDDFTTTALTVLEKEKTEYHAVTGRKKAVRVYDGATTTVKALTHFSYDDVGRLECTAVRMNPALFGNAIADTASACALNTAGAFGPDRIVKNTYTAAGELKDTISAFGVTTANGFPETLQQTTRSRTYTDNGKLESITDANGNKTWYTYDGFDRLDRTCFPPKTGGQIAKSVCEGYASTDATKDFEEVISYDAAGNILEHRKRDNARVLFTYDDLGRVTKRELPGAEPDDHYCYDNYGRLTQASAGGTSCTTGRTIANIYDALGRMTKQTSKLGASNLAVDYAYDAAGRRLTMTWPDGARAAYAYDNTGALTDICGAGSGVSSCSSSSSSLIASYVYDDLGRLDRIDWANDVVTDYAYDGLSRLTLLGHETPSLGDFSFAVNEYNPAGQITRRALANDNYAWTNPASASDAFTANGLNQYTAAGAVSPTYDARGNLTADGLNTYVYDAVNRLVSANTSAVTLVYDAAERLTEIAGSATRAFLYDGDALIAEYDGAGALLRRYVPGPGTDNPIRCENGGSGLTQRCLPGHGGAGVSFDLLSDERGSVVAYANDNGRVEQINTYDGFGKQKPWNEGTFRYTGQTWLPELSLYYYKARLYDPDMGRFLQVDPIGYEDQMNLYAYVGNDPMNLVDPTGECSQSNSGSSLICGLENFIHNHISTPISNALFGIGDEIRTARGLDPIERVDLGGEALQAYEANAYSASDELRSTAVLTAKAFIDSRNPIRSAKRTQGFHGNDSRSTKATELYHLIDLDDGSVAKIGITSRQDRYSARELRRYNVRYEVQHTFRTRRPALVAENIALFHYRIEHGQLPRLNKVTR